MIYYGKEFCTTCGEYIVLYTDHPCYVLGSKDLPQLCNCLRADIEHAGSLFGSLIHTAQDDCPKLVD